MIDFRAVTLNLERQLLDVERRLEGGYFQGNFRSTGTLAGGTTVEFPSRVDRVEAAIQSFHFETKNDHNLEKLKIEPVTRIDDTRRRISISVEASFKDVSPDDDFVNQPFIMTVALLILVDRQ